MKTPLHSLMAEVAAHQMEVLAPRSHVERLRLRSPARVTRHHRGWGWTWLVPATGMAAVLVGLGWRSPTTPLTFAVGGDTTGADEARSAAPASPGHAGELVQASGGTSTVPLRFSDGSLVRLEAGAAARVSELEGEGATVRLDEGRAEIDIRHRAHTSWKLLAGPFEVRVTGTRFTMAWDRLAENVVVTMKEGSVEILSHRLPGSSAVRVTAGQRYSSSSQTARWTIEPVRAGAPEGGAAAVVSANFANFDPAAGSTEPPIVAETAGDVPADVETSRDEGSAERLSTAGNRRWQALARAGRYREALEAVGYVGAFDATCRRLGPEQLAELGDVARLARSADLAEEAYRLARRRFPQMDRPVFGLGLVAFEQRRDYVAAAGWFELYRRQFSSGPLASEAAGRAMESWHRAGDRVKATGAALAYLKETPTGPYAPLARQIAAP